ncbi:diacylglycerol/lipid kinase family protein [Pseudalkalibacillus hwajinpoensis]|uniref:Diacylglycerol kinase family lipid kinase n=1 Tax=Guptibacillus hwajinpoensis TaxID=208199 RepID=A0A4U1MEG2_9BACL|nr:diacylglycerol kinase family protein [Pseudalkalibacillus hwajinpoensis]TKD68704.1 diacylglycerol kinase family lipid kinase [Pseudalkalibacillus hwajinpoensis]
MTRVALILNPKAGNDKMVDQIETIHHRLQEKFDEVTLYKTDYKGHGAELVDQVADQVDVIIGAGGDGTINELANAICRREKRPAFGIIPGGTANDFSRAIGMNQNPLQAVEQLLKDKRSKIDIGCSNDEYFLNFWGIGLITQASENINSDTKEVLGRLSYYISTAQTVSNPEPFHLKVESDEQSFEGEAVMMIVGNGPFTGGIQAFFPQNNLQDGKFDVLIIKESSLSTFWSIFQSKIMKESRFNEGIIHFQTNSLRISTEPEQNIDCDGERHHTTPSSLEVLPDYLTVLTGEHFPE